MMNHEYHYPPSLKKAQQHCNSTLIFRNIDKNNIRRCDCCDRIIGVREFPECNYDPKRMAFLGQGIPLYFQMIKNCLYIMLVITVVLAGYSLYSNYMGNECATGATSCEVNIFNQLSILNKSTNVPQLQMQNYLLLGCIFALIITFQFVRRASRMLENECDRLVDSPSDYSMILRHLPEVYTEQDIMEMINKRRGFLKPQQVRQTNNLSVQKIVMAYSLSELIETKEKNVQNFKKSIEKKEKFNEIPLPIPKKVAPTAIVVFSSQSSKDYFISEPKLHQRILMSLWSMFLPLSDYTVKGQFVSIQRAPQPDDINWGNCAISSGGAMCRRFVGLGITLGFFVVGAGLQIGLQYMDSQITDPGIKSLSPTIISIVVSIGNGIIGILLVYVTKMQRLETLTQYNYRLASKVAFYQFINAGVLVVLANSILDLKNISLTNGLASQITQIMIMNVIVPNISLFVTNYMAPGKWWAKRSIRKTLEGDGKDKQKEQKEPKDVYLQEEVNETFEEVPIDLAARYSFILKTLLLTALYAPFVPLVVPLSICSIFIYYQIQKLLYSRAYKVPNMTSSILDNQMIELLEYIPLVMAIGNWFLYLYFVKFVFQNVPVYYGVPIYISIAVSVVNMMLPMDTLNQCVFPMKDQKYVRPFFKQAEHKFITDYDIANPVYRMQNKKKKNYQFNQNMQQLGQLMEMVPMDKSASNNPFAAFFGQKAAEQATIDSPTKTQNTPLLNKEPAKGASEREKGDSWAQTPQGKLMNKLKPNTPSHDSVKNLLSNQPKELYPVDRQFAPAVPQIQPRNINLGFKQPNQGGNQGGFSQPNQSGFNQPNQVGFNMGLGVAQMGQSMMGSQYRGPPPPPPPPMMMAPNQAAMMMGEAARMSAMGRPPGIGNSYIGHPNNGWGI